MRFALLVLSLPGCLWISASEHRGKFDTDLNTGTMDTGATDTTPCLAAEVLCDGLDNDCDETTPDGPFVATSQGGDPVIVSSISEGLGIDGVTEVEICPGTHWAEAVTSTPRVFSTEAT